MLTATALAIANRTLGGLLGIPLPSVWDSPHPIRDELFSVERLEQHAGTLAAAQPVTRWPPAVRSLHRRLLDNGDVLLASHRAIVLALGQGRAITPAAEWLVDNHHVVDAQLRQIDDDLPEGYYRELPKLADGPLAGYPRVLGIAWAYIAHTDSRFDAESLCRFVAAYQRVQPLTIGELWAVAITLRILLVENLRRSAERIASGRAARQRADELVDRLIAAADGAEVDELLRRADGEPLGATYSVQLLLRLRDQDAKLAPALAWLDRRLAADGTTPDSLVRNEHQRQGGANVTVRNVITSMRAMSTVEWADLFERVSLVDEALRAGSDFAAMDFPTRNLYRSAVEALARRSPHTELAIVRKALAHARAGRTERESDPGHWLIGDGRRAFASELGHRPRLRDWPRSISAATGIRGYLACVALATALVLAWPVLAIAGHASPALVALLAVLAALPAMDAAMAFVNGAVVRRFGAAVLPGLTLADGVPAGLRTLVVVPTLLIDVRGVEADVRQLEVHHLASDDGDLRYALLSDWADADVEQRDDDAPLLATARSAIATLNARHGAAPGGPRFLLLHRRRRWNASQRAWMGWERKRGKLHELNRLLRGARDTDFVDVDPATLPGAVRFVVTLDADTRLPRDALRRLVGKLAHPLNRPRFDPVTGRVVAGYAILQPRVTPSLPIGREGSAFQRVLSSASGIDPYASAVSDVYQDLCDEGSYVGKGIYDVDAFSAALAGRVPDDTLLSHDLFEGIWARAGLVSDVEFVEQYPARYDVAAARTHRWTRGDWQLLPWLFGRRVAGGDRERSRIPLLGRWKMLDNLRRSLVAPAALLALLVGATLPAHAANAWLLWMLAILAAPTLPPVLAAAQPRRAGYWLPIHLRALAADVRMAAARSALTLVFLADQASRALDAIGRTLLRLAVTRRHLLEWVTAAQAAVGPAPSLRDYCRAMAPSLVLALAVLAGIAAGVLTPLLALLALAWLAAPRVALAISRTPAAAGRPALSTADAQALERVARGAWRYFETFVTAADHWLPPDNFQEDPAPVVARRTSPTNIGLYLLSVVAACDRGWIGVADLVERLEATLATLGRLERCHGHFYNWYATDDLRPLEPRYVSTVDSGNLVAHLIAAAVACEEHAAADAQPATAAPAAADLRGRSAALARTMRALVAAMRFGFLYDRERRLLSLGFRPADGTLDPSCYDLLASEARLASFVAIANGDLPARHWFRLGRAVTPVHGAAALLSWSGSMFEYLMPSLVLRSPHGSLLAETNRLIVRRQRDYGAERGVPWGISESAYNARDRALTYQYSGFGVPGLGLQRGLGDSLVIAPYATALAAMVDPRAAAENFAVLRAIGAEGAYGYYEAIDCTPERLPEGRPRAVVRAYMAHHQGMTLVAIANALDDGRMRARFHADPRVQATELLLHERPPREVALARVPAPRIPGDAGRYEAAPPLARSLRTPDDATPRTRILSNGHYAVMLTAAGSGYSRCGELAITRWRADVTCDPWGSFVYLRDVDSGRTWSAGHQPTRTVPEHYEVTFGEDRVQIVRRDGTLVTQLDVAVSAESDAEVRRVSITNDGSRTREIEFTSYAELVLAPAAADAAHPAFSKLFVTTEHVPGLDALLATRRPRTPEEPAIWAAHLAVVEGAESAPPQYETDRARFLGRGNEPGRAHALTGSAPLSATSGTVLDAVFSLRRRVRIPPGATARVAFWTLAAASRQAALDLADKHRSPAAYDRASTLAWTQAQVQLHHLGVGVDAAAVYQRLAGHVLYDDPSLRASADLLRGATGGTPALWSLGISGDLPIVVVRIDDTDDLELVRQLFGALEYWRLKQLTVDLVILNERAPSYAQDLQVALEALAQPHRARPREPGEAAPGGVFVLRSDVIAADARQMLLASARAVLLSRRGSLAEQLERLDRAAPAPAPPAPRRAPGSEPVAARPLLTFDNGYGGFSADGDEYVIVLKDGQCTPAPWINVVANEHFGFRVSAEGSGCSWAGNSRDHQLTPASHDAVSDRPGEVLYVRDLDSGDLWGPTALPIRHPSAAYVARHGRGYSRFEHTQHGVALALTQFVPLDASLKISRLELRNESPRRRRLSITAYVEWVLGTVREDCAASLVTEREPRTGALLARNLRLGAGAALAFMDLGARQSAWTGDRREFIGRNGTLAAPAGLATARALSGTVGGGLDPCGALSTSVELAPGESVAVVWLLGEAANAGDAAAMVAHWRAADLDASLAAVQRYWSELLGTVNVRTPDRALDFMMNGWLLYQALACRVWARAGFYQASGAYGFRDQLQDGMALALAAPALTRRHLLRAAGRQFLEGDVQHWWLPASGDGVRTRISDDRAWLCFCVADYVAVTGDRDVLGEPVPFLDGAPLHAGEAERYFRPSPAERSDTLYAHCALALDRSLAVGAHGLPLIGTGDWNDGMNRVGAAGRGESVWLGWFLHATLLRMAELADGWREPADAPRWRAHARELAVALERDGWDGEWYRRGYYDDGTPLGSATSVECRVDSIAQSWAVLSGAAPVERARRAMDAVERLLLRRDPGLALLFTPPFDSSDAEPGYIKGYPPGIRENGGQYTHAATWTVMAYAKLGDGDRAAEIHALLNPIARSRTPADAQRYRVEPYAVAADVYSEAPHAGRGGWTWYTGSAAWLYRAGLEAMLGCRVRGSTLAIDPCVPRHWPGFELNLRHRGSRYRIVVENPDGVCTGVASLTVDDALVGTQLGRGARLTMVDDHTSHRVVVVLG